MILILNCGSQSIKWKLFSAEGGDNLKLVDKNKLEIFDSEKYKEILEKEFKNLKFKNYKISFIGHRVVHGGEKFREPLKITDENLKELEKISHLAPLHNPYNVMGIKAAREIFPDILQTAVFDTEFFKDLPEYAFTYALPEKIVKESGFRRYGFHGISHEYVARKAAETIKKPFEKLKIITCHLGGGASIAAIKNGKAVDTSMGFTPMQGIVMMTRPGDMDCGIILELVNKFGAEKTDEILNRESGIKGICGQDNYLKVLQNMAEGSEPCKRAFDVFVYSAKKYIGGYFAVLEGCDVLVFTGSIGSGLEITRESICKDLNILKKTKILAIETDEELAIAQKVFKYE